jgi:tetratricopeptide (TPR) repeat protein
MSHRHRHAAVREATYTDEPPYTWIALAIMLLLIGALAGYALSLPAQRGTSSATGSVAPLPAAAAPAAIADENALAAYRSLLASNPKNVQAAIAAGNLLYDAKRWSEAIVYYQQAIALEPANINVSTDLGTALWYAGRADEALAQYAQSLQIDGRHAQTLFNVGIVKSEAKRDYAGAIAAWEQLLAGHPSYPNAAAVRSMIAEARSRLST